jgi:DNA-binding NtrC family response regulator
MSFYLGAALMMFGRKNDELVHVIIPRELENCQPKFYYPTRQKVIGRAEINGQIFEQDYRTAEITISRIPYLKLGNKLPFPEQGLSYRTLVNLLQQHLDHLPDERIEAYPGQYPRSQVMQALLQRARLFPSDEPVLISGESGTGKEVLARYLHNQTPGSSKPFKAVNLGAERSDLINAHLFGYRRGAFTGARSDTAGFFDAACGGTLFLDEIDKLPLDSQPVLLRVLQEKRYVPVGATEEKPVRCRILIGTNRNLKKLVTGGEFLEDLLFRIETFELEIPPLRERLADILPLAHHFMSLYSRKYQKSFVEMDESLENFLLQYPWPGNVRRLENLIKKIVAEQDDFTLKYEFLDESLRSEAQPQQTALDRKIREFIEATLQDTGGNIKEAARLLGMNYTTLHSRLQKCGINASRFKTP